MSAPVKLIIQIPCFNEESSLPITLADLPKRLPGIDVVEWLVIDDGSTDRTVEVAKAHGVQHIISLPKNAGLARAFMVGIEACLKRDADIIVNTDADNQYFAGDIAKLVQPILEGKADMVIGSRPIMNIQHFSPIKKLLQRLGSWTVRVASKTNIPDAPSGFRAFRRQAAMQLNIFSDYTYTLETIIAAGHKGIAMISVPIRVNGEMRPSRLVKSIRSYVTRSLVTIVRIFIVYKPFRFFVSMGVLLFAAGFALALRFLYLTLALQQSGHVQSVVFSAFLMTLGFLSGALGILADLISVNRKLLEKLSWRMWQIEDLLKESRGKSQ